MPARVATRREPRSIRASSERRVSLHRASGDARRYHVADALATDVARVHRADSASVAAPISFAAAEPRYFTSEFDARRFARRRACVVIRALVAEAIRSSPTSSSGGEVGVMSTAACHRRRGSARRSMFAWPPIVAGSSRGRRRVGCGANASATSRARRMRRLDRGDIAMSRVPIPDTRVAVVRMRDHAGMMQKPCHQGRASACSGEAKVFGARHASAVRRLRARQISTCVPSSTTRLVGIPKKSDAFVAFFDIDTNNCSRHFAIPGAPVAISDSRDTKNEVSIILNTNPPRPHCSSRRGTSASSEKP